MISVKDPVCGKEFELGEAKAYEDYRGWAYFFCSDQCHRNFVAHGDRFTGIEQRPRAKTSPPPRERAAQHD